MIEIEYKKISLEEIDRIYSLHNDTFCIICDGDNKKIIIEKEMEEKC